MINENVVQAFTIGNDVEADNVLEEIRDLEIEYNRMEMLAKGKIEIIQAELQKKKEKMQKEVDYRKGMLMAYFKTITPKESKTQAKYKLLNGDLVVKKATLKIVHDDKQILAWAESAAPEVVKEVVTKKLDWLGFKSDLQIVGNDLVRKSTGEVVECPGLGVVEEPAKFEIKY